MRKIEGIQVSESISKQRLIFNEPRVEKIFRVINLLLMLAFLGVLIYALIAIYMNKDDRYLCSVIMPLIYLQLYIVWRIVTEKKLLSVKTSFSKEENHKKLLQFATTKGFEVFTQSPDYLILNEVDNTFGSKMTRSVVIFPQDKLILFTILKDGGRANLAMISPFLLQNNLRLLFKESASSSA